MSIYNVNYYNQVAQMLPPNKRQSRWLWWLFVLIRPIEWLWYNTIEIFKVGYSLNAYAPGTYNKNDVVEYLFKSYISLEDNNTSLPTSSSWEKISDNWRGIDERIKYTANKGTLEYALNLYFRGSWCVLGMSNSGYIWINTNPVASGFFRVGYAGEQSSNVGFEKSSEPIPYEPDVFGAQYAFTVNVQEDLYNALASTNEERESIIRGFVDKYNVAGLFYNIVTYSGYPC